MDSNLQAQGTGDTQEFPAVSSEHAAPDPVFFESLAIQTDANPDSAAATDDVKPVKKKTKPDKQKPLGNMQLGKFQFLLLQLILILRGLTPFVFMPLMIAYMEILLRMLCGYHFWPGLPYAMFVSVTAGFLISIISYLFVSPKVCRVVAAVLLGVFGIIYALQFFMYRSYRVFMSFETIFEGAGNVLGEFTGVFFSALLSGIPVILAFLLPIAFFIVLTRKRIAYTTSSKKVRFRYICVLSAMLVFFMIGQMVILAVSDDDMAAHTTEYNFDSSSRRLGILTGLTLDLRYGIFGNPHTDAVFVFEDLPPTLPIDDPNPIDEPPSYSDALYGPGSEYGDLSQPVPPPRVLGINTIDIDFEALIADESRSAVRSVHEYVASLRASRQNEHTGIFEGKNLILITAEAFSKQVVDPVMTPTLYRLVHNGFYFSDYYQPAWGSSTSGGEYSIISGFAPTSGVRSIQTLAGQNASFTIGHRLKNNDYFSASYHNGRYTYYNRHNTHTKLGYLTFSALRNGMDGHVRNVWPASDLEMMRYSVPQFINRQPFSVYYMTISGHALYTRSGNSMASKNWDAFPEQYDQMSSFIRAYMACNLELEYAMEYLVSALEDAGIADDTVIVISTDHYPYALERSESWGTDRDYLSELFGFPVNTPADRDQSALIIWSGSLENEHKDLAYEVSSPTFSLDILPTLLNLFGLEFDSRLFVGRDVFSDAEPLVFWLNRSWKTENGFFNGSNSTFTPSEDIDVEDEYISRIRSMVNNRINFSGAVLNYDYFNTLFRADGTVR